MNNHSDKKTLNDLTVMLNQLVENSKNKMEIKTEESHKRTPILNRLRKRKKSKKLKLDECSTQEEVLLPLTKKKKPTLKSPTVQEKQSVKVHCTNFVQNEIVKGCIKKSNKSKNSAKSVSPTSSSKHLKVSKSQTKANNQSILQSFLTQSNVKSTVISSNKCSTQEEVFLPLTKKKKPTLQSPTVQEKQSVNIQCTNFVQNEIVSTKGYIKKCNKSKNSVKSVSPISSSKHLKVSKSKTKANNQSILQSFPAQSNVKSTVISSNKHLKDSKSKNKGKTNKQPTLKSFLTEGDKKTFKRNDSFDSIDLPTFSKTKSKQKKSNKLKEEKTSFQKYGVIIPTVCEILKDKEELEYSKSKIEGFIPMSEDSLELPFLNSKLQSPLKEKLLDCKHLSLDELTKNFDLTVDFLSDIVSEKISNSRHQRYFDENCRVLTMSTNDLTYNTSTIVFSYEQLDHLMNLLKKQFDSDDTKTKYFFQVLLPELCLKIFMNTHAMNFDQAVRYLSERPLID